MTEIMNFPVADPTERERERERVRARLPFLRPAAVPVEQRRPFGLPAAAAAVARAIYNTD